MTTNTMNTMNTGAPPALALGLGGSRRLVAVPDYAAASAAYRRACEENVERTGRGASAMPIGWLYDTSGSTPRRIGWTSWNGCCWRGTDVASLDGECLYDPATPTATGGAR